MKGLVKRAEQFAAEAHAGQTRKYTGQPYTVHTTSVADLVREAGAGEQAIAAAHLHDVLEDVGGIRNPWSKFGTGTIQAEFGHEVFQLVFALTDVYTKENFPQFNRVWRKELERNRYTFMNWEVKTIKLADLIDNTRDIARHDPKFAIVYIAEKRALLAHLVGGDERLYRIATSQLNEFKI